MKKKQGNISGDELNHTPQHATNTQNKKNLHLSYQKTIKEDIIGAFSRLDLALFIAWSETKNRYRRSLIGPFWLVIGTIISVGGLSFVWSSLFGNNRDFFVTSLSLGLIVWYLLSSTIVESTTIFQSNHRLIHNIPVSSLLISSILLFKHLINFAHNCIIIAFILIIFPENLNFYSFLVIPGFLLVTLNLLSLIQILGYIGARYRDLAPFITAIMQPMFFITPVLFHPDKLGSNSIIAEINPLSHCLNLIRDPLMGRPPSNISWLVMCGLLISTWVFAIALTAKKRHLLPYWIT